MQNYCLFLSISFIDDSPYHIKHSAFKLKNAIMQQQYKLCLQNKCNFKFFLIMWTLSVKSEIQKNKMDKKINICTVRDWG